MMYYGGFFLLLWEVLDYLYKRELEPESIADRFHKFKNTYKTNCATLEMKVNGRILQVSANPH
jgi:hypothetical protein